MFVLLVYVVSALAWGMALWELARIIYFSRKRNLVLPPLLVPLTIAAFSIFFESLYFGVGSYFVYMGRTDLYLLSLNQEYWFVVKVFVAISGIFLLVNLKGK